MDSWYSSCSDGLGLLCSELGSSMPLCSRRESKIVLIAIISVINFACGTQTALPLVLESSEFNTGSSKAFNVLENDLLEKSLNLLGCCRKFPQHLKCYN